MTGNPPDPVAAAPFPLARALSLGLALLAALSACERPPKRTDAPAPAPGDYATRPGAPGAETAAPGADLPVILCLGDSLTAGHGVPEERAYPAQLQAKLAAEGYRYRVVNAGVSGDTSKGGLARMDWLLRQRVDILIVALAANDGLRGIDPEDTRSNLAAIIEQGRAYGARVVLAGMLMPINYGADYKRRFDAIFPELARRYDLPFLPFLLEGVATRRDLNLPDGIHPTGEGYTIVVENLWPVLEPLLKRS